ncbi:insulin-like [Centruroides vittatus]|uniref:insulin-like n=1 Tax=Centruroides vittatus TaxID=120091 RepID=UPI00350EB305
MKLEVLSIVVLSFYLFVFLTNASISSSLQQRTFYRRRIQVCGPELSDVLSLICNGTYYNPHSRRFISTYHDLSNPYWNLVSSSYRYPLQNIPAAFSDRKKRGVVDECCRNSCTFEQITAYCGSSESEEQEEERNLWMK